MPFAGSEAPGRRAAALICIGTAQPTRLRIDVRREEGCCGAKVGPRGFASAGSHPTWRINLTEAACSMASVGLTYARRRRWRSVADVPLPARIDLEAPADSACHARGEDPGVARRGGAPRGRWGGRAPVAPGVSRGCLGDGDRFVPGNPVAVPEATYRERVAPTVKRASGGEDQLHAAVSDGHLDPVCDRSVLG
jgi:hypothetical protein